MDRQMNGNVMMGRDNMGQRMMGQNTMGRNMMGRNIYNIMSNRGMTSDMSNMMGQQMDSDMMGRDMTVDVMGRNNGTGQVFSDDEAQHDGPPGHDSQHDVQQHDGPRHDGHGQQPNVLQDDELQQPTYGPAHDAADGDGACSRDLHFHQILLSLSHFGQAFLFCVQNIVGNQ